MYCKTIIMKNKWQDHNDWLPLFQREKRAWKRCVLCGRGRLRKEWIITFHATLKHRIHSVWLHAVIIASVQAIVYSHDINEKKESKSQTCDFWLILQNKSAINSLLNGSQEHKSFHWVAIIKVNKYVLNGTYT